MPRFRIFASLLLVSVVSSAAQQFEGSQGYGEASGYGYGSYGYSLDSYYGRGYDGSYAYVPQSVYGGNYGYGSYGYVAPSYFPSYGSYGYTAPSYYPSYGAYGYAAPSYYPSYGAYGYTAPGYYPSYGYNGPAYYYVAYGQYTAPGYGTYNTEAALPDDESSNVPPVDAATPPALATPLLPPSQPSTPTTARRLLNSIPSSTPGQCYCPYDHDWNAWAIVDPRCRSALYAKCQEGDSVLPCSWLDAYFSAAPSTAGFKRPHELDIQSFLYNDCPPAKPCACAALTFTQTDKIADVYNCCNDLKVFAQVPFSGIDARTVYSYCTTGKGAQTVKTWLHHALWNAECPATATSSVYTFQPTRHSTVVVRRQGKRSSVTSLPSASRSTLEPIVASAHLQVDDSLSSSMNLVTVVAAACGAMVGAALAVVVILSFARPRRGDADQGLRYAALV